MQETKTVKANIDYPQEEELVVSPHYTFRIKAPMNAEKVEVCVDGAPWRLCRYSSGFWWYDWTDYGSGEHELVARILPFDSRNYALRTRRFTVQLEGSPASRGVVTEYSLMTADEPWLLAKLTQMLSKEEITISGLMTMKVGDTACVRFTSPDGTGLKEKLEAAGLHVSMSDVLQVRIPNKPGELSRLCKSLAEKMIGVQAMQSTPEGERVRVVLAVDQPESCAKLVGEMGYSPC